MKTFIKYIILIAVAVFLSSCVPNEYSNSDATNEINTGRNSILKYLENAAPESTITNINMVTGAKVGQSVYMGYYATHFVEADFAYNNKSYKILVNNENGEIWTNLNNYLIDDYYKLLLDPYCERYELGSEFAVSGPFLTYNLVSHNIEYKKELIDTEFELTDMLPSTVNAENIGEFVKKNMEICKPGILYIYYNSDKTESFDARIFRDFCADNSDIIAADGKLVAYNISANEFSAIQKHEKPSKGYQITLTESYSCKPANGGGEYSCDYAHRIMQDHGEYGFSYIDLKRSYTTADESLPEGTAHECPLAFDGKTLTMPGEENLHAYIYFNSRPTYDRAYVKLPDKESREFFCELPYGLWTISLSPDGVNGIQEINSPGTIIFE